MPRAISSNAAAPIRDPEAERLPDAGEAGVVSDTLEHWQGRAGQRL